MEAYANGLDVAAERRGIKKKLAAVDGSEFKAADSKDRSYSEERLRERMGRLEVKIGECLAVLEAADREESGVERGKSAEKIRAMVKQLEEGGEVQKSLSNADSRLMRADGEMEARCNAQTAADATRKVIAAFEVAGGGNGKNRLVPMAAESEEAVASEGLGVVADRGYGSARDVVVGMEAGMAMHAEGRETLSIVKPVMAARCR
jgi:transposase